MLVVLAISAILLGLIITPLVGTFNFTNRARATVQVQDAARYAMELSSREIADAMDLAVSSGDYEPFMYYTGGAPGEGDGVVVRSQGYVTAWDGAERSWELSNAMIDLVLPHDELGLEGGGIEQPLIPQHLTADDGKQHPVIVRYFVGLTNPVAPAGGSGNPVWHNNVVTGIQRPQNLYTLYRVEFDPYDPRFSNWAIPSPNNEAAPDGRKVMLVNPNFFYDNTEIPYNGQSKSAAAWWREKAVAIMPTDGMDLVDFIRQDPKDKNSAITGARSLVTFNPLVVASDTAAPADNDRRPTTYKTQYGHWSGVQNDGTVRLAYVPNVTGSFPAGAMADFLPRITVWDQDAEDDNDQPIPGGGVRVELELDSAEADSSKKPYPGNRRDLTWDNTKGIVSFALRAPVYDNSGGRGNGLGPSIYDPLSTSPDYTAIGGGAKNKSSLSPGTEIVTVWERDPSNNNNRIPVVYSRMASDIKDVFEVPEEIAVQNGMPQQLPPPRQYIVTDTGLVIIGYPYPNEANAVQSQPVPDGTRVTIDYMYQTNNPRDLVRVDYLTREVITINMTARLYDPVNRKPITTTVADRVRVRNMQR
jgi:hypothetical protein